ncbi:DUF4961 domain-containing protein [Mucilaginibacter litoreus]|uniref:DUF4961 domain-containing protein n=1 Tax=Mucilaginibacter litoreus TaxID=1048221 RepID=A0ABW3AS43_9SPHI
MIKHLRNVRKKLLKYTGLAALILLLSNCEFVINFITQPLTANAGEQITAVLDANFRINGGPYTKNIVIGILAPRSWKLAQNTTITYTSAKGPGTFKPIPPDVVAGNAKNGENWTTIMKKKMGIGPNYIDDMEWVPFITTQTISANNNDDIHAVFTIKMKVGVDGQNTSVRLGYVVCNDTDGLDDGSPYLWPFKFADCLEVKGAGDLIDFCNPSLSILNPVKALDNDYETITFDNTVVNTELKGQTDIYLCATAHTSDGKDIAICTQDDRSKMIEAGANKFQIVIWPRQYFNLSAGQTITSVDYYFTNKAGNVKVGYGNTDAPFKLRFVCD